MQVHEASAKKSIGVRQVSYIRITGLLAVFGGRERCGGWCWWHRRRRRTIFFGG